MRQSALLLYAGHAPVQLPAGSAGASALSLTLINHPTPNVGEPLPAGAQYLVYEPNYTGAYTVSSTCNPPAVANTSFEPSSSGNGPGAILDVTSSGVFGPQSCTLSVNDTLGHSATIAVSDKQLLIYPGVSGGVPPNGAAGTAFYLDVSFTPGTFLVYEHGYSGAFTVAPSSCSTFAATLKAPVDPGSGSALTVSAKGPPTPEVCTFAVSDSNGNQAFVQAAYEGV